MKRRDPYAADRAVSQALDHFQNRYYELHKAVAEMIEAFDRVAEEGLVNMDANVQRLDEAITVLRERVRVK